MKLASHIHPGSHTERTTKKQQIEEYQVKYPGARVVACTNTTKRHADLVALGAEPVLELPTCDFQNVAFLATPNANNYVELCKQSLQVWTGPAAGGSFILASSIGVFAKGLPEATRINEQSPTNASSSNFSRTIVGAEDEVCFNVSREAASCRQHRVGARRRLFSVSCFFSLFPRFPPFSIFSRAILRYSPRHFSTQKTGQNTPQIS